LTNGRCCCSACLLPALSEVEGGGLSYKQQQREQGSETESLPPAMDGTMLMVSPSLVGVFSFAK
jgi:hypothetical protein